VVGGELVYVKQQTAKSKYQAADHGNKLMTLRYTTCNWPLNNNSKQELKAFVAFAILWYAILEVNACEHNQYRMWNASSRSTHNEDFQACWEA
jgi:hypothetical protein